MWWLVWLLSFPSSSCSFTLQQQESHNIARLWSTRDWKLFTARPSLSQTATTSSSSTSITDNEKDEQSGDDSALQILAGNAAICLMESDRKRAKGLDGSSTGWTSWVDEASAFLLQNTVEKLCLRKKSSATGDDDDQEMLSWTRWLTAPPSALTVELSDSFRALVLEAIGEAHARILGKIDTSLEEFLPRISLRLICLPSGSTLDVSIRTAPGAMVYGKLLSGGVTRFRLLGGGSTSNRPQRRAGERTVVVDRDGNTEGDNIKSSWLQYGGPERNYKAVDMGSCFILELTLLPAGLEVPLLADEDSGQVGMAVTDLPDSTVIERMFEFFNDGDGDQEADSLSTASTSEVVDLDVCDLEESFCSTVGGLRPQIDAIVRRVLDGRVVRSVSNGSEGTDDESGSASRALDAIRRQEMLGLLELGLEPVRGLLLYGPPGCGKTRLAREISTLLDARPPKIVAAPELLDRWVGGSEKLIRDLFKDAESELKACGDDPTKSALHVVVIDECDAVFRRRSAAAGDSPSETTRSSAVNQILAKLDGVNGLGNVLLIGMTNRKELLDEALLRPGRMEVHVEIPLPDKDGRREILKIHFGPLRSSGRLSKTLCEAIDGRGVPRSEAAEAADSNADSPSGLRTNWKTWFREKLPLSSSGARIRDLADRQWTGGFSGADLAGLVRAAGSYALERTRSQGGDTGLESLLITMEDVAMALEELQHLASYFRGLDKAGWTMGDLVAATGQGKEADRQKNVLKNELLQIVRKLEEQQFAWPFREPIDVNEVPDYFTVVKTPIDLSTIEKRIRQDNHYKSKPMLYGYLMLMVNNCKKKYNGDGSPYM